MSEASAESANPPTSVSKDIEGILQKLNEASGDTSWQDLMTSLQAATNATYDSRYDSGQGENIPPTVTITPLKMGEPREDQFQPIVILTAPVQIIASGRKGPSVIGHDYVGVTASGPVVFSFEQRGYSTSKSPKEAGATPDEIQFRMSLSSADKKNGELLPMSDQGIIAEQGTNNDSPNATRFMTIDGKIFDARPLGDLEVVKKAIQASFPSRSLPPTK